MAKLWISPTPVDLLRHCEMAGITTAKPGRLSISVLARAVALYAPHLAPAVRAFGEMFRDAASIVPTRLPITIRGSRAATHV